MIEINNKTRKKINKKSVKELTERFLRTYKKTNKEVSIAFVGDQTIKKLNQRYRKINKPTDILSFSGEGNFLGELIIDYRQIERQAKEYKKSVQNELNFILIHGLLHLLGYNDETEQDRLRMIKLAENFLKK